MSDSYSSGLRLDAVNYINRGNDYAMYGQFDHAVGCYRKADKKIAQAERWDARPPLPEWAKLLVRLSEDNIYAGQKAAQK